MAKAVLDCLFRYGLVCYWAVWPDVYSKVTKKQTAISRIRVKKFCSSSSFSSNSEVANAFERPYTLSQGLQNTLDCEFIDPDSDREVFFTE